MTMADGFAKEGKQKIKCHFPRLGKGQINGAVLPFASAALLPCEAWVYSFIPAVSHP